MYFPWTVSSSRIFRAPNPIGRPEGEKIGNITLPRKRSYKDEPSSRLMMSPAFSYSARSCFNPAAYSTMSFHALREYPRPNFLIVASEKPRCFRYSSPNCPSVELTRLS